MILEDKIKKAIKEHSLTEKPKECCGVILEKEGDSLVFECKNVATDPQNIFSLSPVDYLKASKEGTIKAVYHSHNNEKEEFSSYDKSNSQSHRLDYVLYNTVKNSFSVFDYKKNKTFLYNKSFKTQTSDCYSLVKEYYQKLDINLLDKNNSRKNPDWHDANPNLIDKIFKLNVEKNTCLFHKIEKTTFKEHDILSFELIKGKGPVHVGVYLGDGTFMHHPRGKYPCIEPLNKSYEKRIHSIFRYEKFN